MIAWGVDPGLRRFYIAVVGDGKLLGVYGDEFTKGKDDSTATTLRRLQSRVEDCAMSAWAEHGAPDAIIVEQPSGSFENLSLKYAVGVTLAAVSKHGYADTLPSKSWRKTIFGNGNMRTADAKRAALLTAATVGYTGDSEDAAEAVCIALAVEKEITKG